MANEIGKVLRRHRMAKEGMVATLTCQGGDQYEVVVHKEMGGLFHVVKKGALTAVSNRLALKKMKRWLDVRFPVPVNVNAQVETPRSKIEDLFMKPCDITCSSNTSNTADTHTKALAACSQASQTGLQPRATISLNPAV